MFGFSVLVAVAAVAKGVKTMNTDTPHKPRDYYEWNESSLKGHALYRKLGCNSCHRALGVGEIGVAPVLDGEGTKRTLDWLQRYLRDPTAMVAGTAHDGTLAPDFRQFNDPDRTLLAAFLFALKANPGSPNYPVPPLQAELTDELAR